MRVWKKVPNVACLASDDGKIRQLNPTINRIRNEFERPQYTSHLTEIYKYVNIHSKPHYVHKLVAAAFHGPCPEGMVVDHIDENKLNNHANNLRYLTRCENVSRSKLSGHPTCLKSEQVREIRALAQKGVSRKELALKFKVSIPTIATVIKHQGGYK